MTTRLGPPPVVMRHHAPTGRSYRPSPHSLRNRIKRGLWGVAWLTLFRPSPKPFHAWRRALLKAFGARIGRGANIHASVRIWAPWNLHMEEFSTLSPNVDCYCVAPIHIGSMATVSQYSFLCTASHDIDSPNMILTTAPIDVGAHAWIAADAFVGPGVRVGEGAVLGARSSAFRDLPAWTVSIGSPARPVRSRSRAVTGESIASNEQTGEVR
jgi:putative colanic acid biosynthesis acetyltransferase WcaF